jgi:hypothetical protein
MYSERGKNIIISKTIDIKNYHTDGNPGKQDQSDDGQPSGMIQLQT